MTVQKDNNYNRLEIILDCAYNQAAHGKGKKRHANGEPWHEQKILQIAHRHGIGFLTGQAEKKLTEAVNMFLRGDHLHAEQELLGTIVYCAAAIEFISQTMGSAIDEQRPTV